ncbi:uncharacterized protein LOC126412394 [Schistocerca serialis cubense]|uniref:uncharacterized protein LOC126412394 n=1 Tax=Schistocerca serialis cubense TaxID=2023355 RepID=UPI00214E667C|nr:uncharacterized protein LOC126412394 [Schistocerca serialis cubense]XP_049937929.1 uncharacterized protein LOC126412394 [Schistocerca serialis cubense]
MTETGLKQVKVDNWGVFFLQRLHHFFSKNEFCDLILLFKNAERIKVHRVVLYACTEYFQLLEKENPPGSHLLRMPEDMDPEVVVPIINFMYTGRLEFKYELHSKLYSAAKVMSMSVLTKLLDAQYNSASVQGSLKPATVKKLHVPSHTSWNLPVKKVVKTGDSQLPEPLPGRKLPIWKRRSTLPVITPHIEDSTPVIFSSPLLLAKSGANARHEDVSGPMRFDWPDVDLKPQTYHPSFDDITYETKPLVRPADTPKTPVSQSSSHSLTSTPVCSLNNVKKEVQQTASFEEVRRTAVAIKRPSYGDSAGASPEKQPKMVDLQAVKEYVQEHQLRKDLVEIEDGSEDVDDDMAVADYDDDDDDADAEVEGEGSRDDDHANAKESGNSEENVDQQQNPESITKPPVPVPPPQPAKSILKTQASHDGAAPSNANSQVIASVPKRVRFSLGDNTESSEGKENEAKVDTNVTTSPPTREADSVASNQEPPEENLANHAKIITEVLKKYPHLVNNKKNIKLKILRRGQDGTSSCKNVVDGKGVKSKVSYVVLKPDAISKGKPITGSVALKHGNKVEPLSELPSSVLAAAGSGGSGSTSAVSAKNSLVVSRPVASGAENTTGPWLCYSCGNDGDPVNFETYYLYRRHLQDIHMEKIDARICEHCGHRASKRNLLLYHLYTRHNVPPPRNCQFPRCDQCEYVALSESLLIKHRNNHTNNREFVCKVCNATFKSNGALQGHIQANLHSDPAKKNYECPICHKPFVRNINLKAHLRTAHGDVARKADKEEPEHEVRPGRNEVTDSNCMVTVQQSKAGTVVLAPAVTVLASGPAGPVQTLVPSSEAEALSNVASGIAASLGLSTGALNGDQTVIVLDDNREYILGSAGDTEVQDYVEEQMVHADTQEYIVPEIMSGEEVHPYEGTVVTTAGGTSFSTIVQRPTLNQAIVPPPIQVSEGGNAEGIGVVISDHDYANEVALRGMTGEGMMFIITQPGPNGNTILQTGHIAAPQQHTEVYTHQLTQHLQHQFVQQQQFREQKTQKLDQLCLQQQQQQQQQQPQRQQTAQQQVTQEKILQTVQQQKQDQHKHIEQQLPSAQQLQNKDQQLQPQHQPHLPPLRQQQTPHQQQQLQPQQQPSELQVQVQAQPQHHQDVLCRQQRQEDLKPQEQHLQHHQNCQVETLQHQQQLLQEQLLQEQRQEQSVQRKQPLHDNTEIHQELISSAYLVQQNNIGQEITNIIASGSVQAKVVEGTSEGIVVSRTNTIISQDARCVRHKPQDTDGGIRPVTVRAEQASVVQSIMDNVGISQGEVAGHSVSERVKVESVSLEADIATTVAQQVPVFDTACTSNAMVQPEGQGSEQELVMAEMQNIVPDGAGDSYSAHRHIQMPDVSEARRMASDLVKDWDEFDEDSCDFVGSQLAQKNKDTENSDSCVS